MLRASKWLRFSAGELILRNCSYKKPLLLTTCFCSPPAHECLLLQRSISSSSSGICGSYSTYLPWKNPRSRTSSAGTLNVKNFLSDSGFFSAPSKPPSAMLNGRVLFSSSAPRKPNGNQDHGGKSSITTAKSEEKQVADMKILRTLVSYLWMKDNYEFRLRVITAFAFLVGAKVLNVQVPFLFKLVVDWLTTATGNAPALASFTTANSTLIALFATPASVLIGYGIARCGASAFNELRTAVFSKVALRTIRQVSRKVVLKLVVRIGLLELREAPKWHRLHTSLTIALELPRSMVPASSQYLFRKENATSLSHGRQWWHHRRQLAFERL
ncbi:ABC transporter B family member 25, mitochondrial [Manihot esculenta]|uniref:ABC transmembrane type-1 domain-containing protein n=1 Tax=Manihot esculenta TaxID=3983 RepID=A0A2C9V4B3_MANES|nr:ABC transporter B family member 25, mitochondrial [Manihot esculenta]